MILYTLIHISLKIEKTICCLLLVELTLFPLSFHHFSHYDISSFYNSDTFPIPLAYTLLFGNNFISESPKSVGVYDQVLFSLDEDVDGPYLTTQMFESSVDNLIVKVEKNICTFYDNQELVMKRNERDYLLIDNKVGENILQSRVLDRETLLVSGIFWSRAFVLIATQNYIVLPDGKRMMHNRVRARNSHITITDEGIKTIDEYEE